MKPILRIRRGALSPDTCGIVRDYVQLRADTATLRAPDPRVPDAPRLYRDPLTDTILIREQSQVEEIVREPLWPSYSYLRLHLDGAALPMHTDRPFSEIAVSICIAGDLLWPINFRTERRDRAVSLKPGDAVVYEGQKLPHWRDPFQGTWQIQCMLFYIRQADANRRYQFHLRPPIDNPDPYDLLPIQHTDGVEAPTGRR